VERRKIQLRKKIWHILASQKISGGTIASKRYFLVLGRLSRLCHNNITGHVKMFSGFYPPQIWNPNPAQVLPKSHVRAQIPLCFPHPSLFPSPFSTPHLYVLSHFPSACWLPGENSGGSFDIQSTPLIKLPYLIFFNWVQGAPTGYRDRTRPTNTGGPNSDPQDWNSYGQWQTRLLHDRPSIIYPHDWLDGNRKSAAARLCWLARLHGALWRIRLQRN